MIHARASDEVIETAALYAMGTLPDDERAAFERHLAEGCDTCAREVASFEPVVAALGQATPAVAPPPEVRVRLLERLASPRALVRAGGAGWSREAPGVEARVLYRDAGEGQATSLVRLQPGARRPGRRAAGAEEIYVIEGDLAVRGERLGAGDYCAVPGAAAEGDAVSEAGCTLVLVASERESGPAPAAGASTARPAVTVARAREGAWRPGVAPGVETRQLARDASRGTVTARVRMAPGARLPGHRHVTAEQLYMLAGDAHVDGETLGPGDYYRTAAGTAHDVTHTEQGCEFLLISSAVELLA